MQEDKIVTIENKKDEKSLREKTAEFAFSERGELMMRGKKITAQEISSLILQMKKMMKLANGIGLSANQIGLPYKLFIAQVPDKQGDYKFYAIFNPQLEKASAGKVAVEEGCLSIPGIYGEVERHEQVTLRGFDKKGKPLKIKAWGLLARVFQHEVDHLNGKLFIDRTKVLYHAPASERLKEKEGRAEH